MSSIKWIQSKNKNTPSMQSWSRWICKSNCKDGEWLLIFRVATRTRRERREGKSLQKEEWPTKSCCRSQENEVQQLGVPSDLNKSHFSWMLEVTSGLWGLGGEKAEWMLYIFYEDTEASPIVPSATPHKTSLIGTVSQSCRATGSWINLASCVCLRNL